ncbi:hypothetical protein KVH31_34450 [Streptomyces olivaceus]|uniref:Rad52/Rad22 family DNA repair protein n=1 Tax=Streptomyces olivaceus TaxID=47716 RepID=UPI001CCA14BF|nr:Rad52/Rad22 family DNA repair protein [Streptomyces olivaceus]MBZ6211598.1 hypothetical protein [Streptomyces olivaceus]
MPQGTEAPARTMAEGPTSHTQNQVNRLTAPQLRLLHRGLDPKRVGKDNKNHAHMEAWDIKRYLLRVFGFAGYDTENRELALVREIEIPGQSPTAPSRWTVVYRAQVRLTVKDVAGRELGHWDGEAVGDSYNQPKIGDAHDMAMKGLALDTPIPTPDGWTTMGALRVGDTVFDKDGQPVRVMATSPVKNLDCYRVTFRNGRSIVCDEEHYWVAKVAQEKTKVHRIGALFAAKEAGKPVVIPVAEPLATAAAALPMDPWVLGYWLGNGDRNAPRVTCHGDDVTEVVAAVTSAGYEVGAVRPDDRGNTGRVGIRGLGKVLAGMGLLGSKHVPAEYLRGSVEQRRALLAGLMDSDGTVDKRGRVMFTSTAKEFSDAVAELARSLGETVTQAEIERTGYGKTVLSYDVQWTPIVSPFALSRKASRLAPRTKARYGHRVASIELIDSVPTRCISVDSPSRTFLASEDMIPTHNTAASQALKRAATNLGDQFGLSLYNNGSPAPVVGFCAAHPPTEWEKVAEPVPEPNDPPVQPEQGAQEATGSVTVDPECFQPHPDGQEFANQAGLATSREAVENVRSLADGQGLVNAGVLAPDSGRPDVLSAYLERRAAELASGSEGDFEGFMRRVRNGWNGVPATRMALEEARQKGFNEPVPFEGGRLPIQEVLEARLRALKERAAQGGDTERSAA